METLFSAIGLIVIYLGIGVVVVSRGLEDPRFWTLHSVVKLFTYLEEKTANFVGLAVISWPFIVYDFLKLKK